MNLLGESRAVQLVGIQGLHSLVMAPEGQPLVAQEQVLLISCFMSYLCCCFLLLLFTCALAFLCCLRLFVANCPWGELAA